MFPNSVLGMRLKKARGNDSVFDWFEKIKAEVLAKETGLTYTIRKSCWGDSKKYPCEFIKATVSKECDGENQEFMVWLEDNVEEIFAVVGYYCEENREVFGIMMAVFDFLKEHGFNLVNFLN